MLSGEDETLLVGRDALLVLNLGLDIVDGVGGLDLESDGLSGEGFNEDLHAGMWRGVCSGGWRQRDGNNTAEGGVVNKGSNSNSAPGRPAVAGPTDPS